jgi:DNA (cytosine-5)-methyltransferase 1
MPLSGRLQLLLAGPSCVHFSRARGGKPTSDQQRADPWCILRWLSELTVDSLIVENVPEFADWCPVGVSGRPIASKRGEMFRAWVRAIEAAGYRVEHRVLCAADYGDPTTRRRLFVLAQRGGRRIEWPEPTHSRAGGRTLFGSTQRWRPAREIIDWTIHGRSIFDRERPLSRKTLARIVEGLRRFGGRDLQPFLVQLTHGGRLHDLDRPMPTVTGANRGDVGLAQPFILQQQSGGAPRPVSDPLPTIASSGAQALVEPFLVPLFGERQTQAPRVHSLDEPLPTITATKGGPCLVEPIVTSYYSRGQSSPVSDPLPTVTARDRFALVVPEVEGRRLDVRFRMLQPHELAAAMSFGAEYSFTGTRGDQVRQIGNAWPVRLGQALITSLIQRHAQVGREVREVAAK